MSARVLLCAAVAVLAATPGATEHSSGSAVQRTFLREPTGPAFPASSRWAIDMMDLPAAWDITTGGAPGPLIAVIDTGVHITPDLVGRVVAESLVGADPASDAAGHGTKVAGGVAASGADGIGLAGVCWSCRILSLQVSTGGTVSADLIAAAVNRAVARGAVVINLSLGADLHTNAERDAIARAVAAGVVVVAAAGNDGTLTPQFPAAYAGVLAVGAADRDGTVASFSSHGPWVGVLALACAGVLDARDLVDDAFCGTSASAPFVSGLAGLLKSLAPAAKGPDIIAAIQRSAHRAAGSAHGVVDAAAALVAIKKIKPGSTGQTKGALLRLVRRPMISGVGAVGARLAASTGDWSSPITSIAMHWERCTRTGRPCRTVSKSSTYRIVRPDRGKAIRVVVRATGEDGVAVVAASHLLPVRR